MTTDTLYDSSADTLEDFFGNDGAVLVGVFLIFDTGEFIEFDDGSIMEIT